MTTRIAAKLPPTLLIATLLAACAYADGDWEGSGPGGKTDTGWVSDDSFEVGARIEARILRTPEGYWADLATDPSLQEELLDTQLKYAKRTAKRGGYVLNQLVYKVRDLQVAELENGDIELRYVASVDLVRHNGGAPVPELEELPQLDFEAPLPLDPTDVMARVGLDCASDWGEYTVRENNYYYYFNPDQPECDLELTIGNLTIEKVFPRKTVYPEYDRLLNPLPDSDNLGFRAALFPTLGDDDPDSIHAGFKNVLENRFGLEGEWSADGYQRYRWVRDGAEMVIDLYDPQRLGWYFKSVFQQALASYQLVHFAGHSNYGTRDLITTAEAFMNDYQVFMMWACYSYAYYARQVFRAKATVDDPDGFAAADFVGTAPTPYFSDEDEAIEYLLRGLMDGIAAVSRGEEEAAPSWVDIIAGMNRYSWDRPYGAAGARDNLWQPGN
jgi:hypothetical protein